MGERRKDIRFRAYFLIMQGRKKYFLALTVTILIAVLFATYEVISFSWALGAPSAENIFFKGETTTYLASAEISDPSLEIPALGFSPDTSEINFGIVPGGGNYATKFIDISNRGDTSVTFIFRSDGNISGMVEFGRNNFAMTPGDSANVPIKFLTGNGAATGKYIGRIFVSQVIAKNPISSTFLRLL